MVRMIGALILALGVSGPLAAKAQTAEMPAPLSFHVGDRWEWRQIDNYTGLEERRPSRLVIKEEGVLKFANDKGERFEMSNMLVDGGGLHGAGPWRDWPLAVGKTWVYDADWQRDDGATGHVKQDVKVLAYEEVSVPAGKFMAFKIEYRGFASNNRSNKNLSRTDTVWYAPDVKAEVKHVRDDLRNRYTRELLSFVPAPPEAK